jgi:hypothetical protein
MSIYIYVKLYSLSKYIFLNEGGGLVNIHTPIFSKGWKGLDYDSLSDYLYRINCCKSP